MRVLDTPWSQWRIDEPVALTLGVYDGVHCGHRAVIDTLAQAADGLPLAVFTFRGHPLELSAPDHAPQLLTTYEQKLEQLEAAGIDICAVPAFDMQLRTQSPTDFAAHIMVDRLSAQKVVVGSDFRFGYERAGDVDLLARIGPELGFDLVVVDLVGETVPYSSSAIRKALDGGEVERAAAMLGRPFQLRAEVVPGDGRGRTIGIPTANLAVSSRQAVPRRGVYAATVPMDGGRQPAVVNIGIRPTFGGETEVVEVHLLEYDADLYGKQLSVDFVGRIRAEQRFDGAEALIEQIHRDITQARSMLAAVNN